MIAPKVTGLAFNPAFLVRGFPRSSFLATGPLP
jgi:hypothetical protein